MPLLSSLIASLFGGLTTFLAAVLGAQLAARVAASAVVLGVAGALLLLFNATVAPLAAQAFSTPFGSFIGLAFPPVAGTCLAGVATTWAACTAYRLQANAIAFVAGR